MLGLLGGLAVFCDVLDVGLCVGGQVCASCFWCVGCFVCCRVGVWIMCCAVGFVLMLRFVLF